MQKRIFLFVTLLMAAVSGAIRPYDPLDLLSLRGSR